MGDSKNNQTTRTIGAKLWKIWESIIRFFLGILFRILRKDLTDDTFQKFMQFVKFCMIGLTNTLVSYLVYVTTLAVFRATGQTFVLKIGNTTFEYDYILANIMAFLLSVIWSWFWNSRLVFKAEEGEKRIWWKTLLKTYGAYAFTGLFLANFISFLWISVLHMPKLLAPVVYTITDVPINYFLNKFWAYAKEKPESKS